MLDVYVHQDPRPATLESDARTLAEEVCRNKPRIIGIDGPPGAGKGTLVRALTRNLIRKNVPIAWMMSAGGDESWTQAAVSTDSDLPPRELRRNHEHDGIPWPDFHRGRLPRKAMGAHLNPIFASGVDMRVSDTYYKGSFGPSLIHVPGEKGVLLVEGVRAAEHILSFVGRQRTEVQNRVMLILIDHPHDEVEHRRIERDLKKPGLTPDEVKWRIESQRTVIHDYCTDLDFVARRTPAIPAFKKRVQFIRPDTPILPDISSWPKLTDFE